MEKTKIALVYDADYTLMNQYHPNLILARRGIDPDEFWKDVSSRQKLEESRGEKTNLDIIYLASFMNEVRHGKLNDLTIAEVKVAGLDLEQILYPGLPEFFEDIKKANSDCDISHTIVSVGIKPLLEGSVLGKYMNEIYGYTFFDDYTPGPAIDEIKSTVSSREKIPAVVGVSYGNAEQGFEFPIRNMIYFGDGQTDVPAFRFVKRRNGLAVCVYDKNKQGTLAKAKGFQKDVNLILPANYRKGNKLWREINKFIRSRCK